MSRIHTSADMANASARNRDKELKPLLSAIVCTHNREKYVAQTISSLIDQDFPVRDYEVIVVDNMSTDNTRYVIEKMAQESEVEIRYIHESRLGVSHARNTGLSAARGTYIAYIDDDEEASSLWIRSIIEVFNSVEPEPGIVCGPVHPTWETQPPSWLGDKITPHLSVFILEDNPAFIDVGWFPEGNSAFRTEILRAVGGFATNLGRKGKNLISGECWRVEEMIRARGYGVYYAAGMRVGHFIPAERVRLSWLTKRCFYQGFSEAVYRVGKSREPFFIQVKHICLYSWWIFPPLIRAIAYAFLMLSLPSKKHFMYNYACNLTVSSRKFGWLVGTATCWPSKRSSQT